MDKNIQEGDPKFHEKALARLKDNEVVASRKATDNSGHEILEEAKKLNELRKLSKRGQRNKN
jgi:hypothetical protein